MNGRMKSELKLEEAIKTKLSGMPDYVRQWDMNMKASRRTAATRRDYVFKICNFLESIDSDVSRVTVDMIDEEAVTSYYTSIQTKNVNGDASFTSDSYQQTVWSCLNNFLEYLKKRNLVSQNYMMLIQRPKNKDLERINEHRVMLNKDDFKRILISVDDVMNLTRRNRDRAILMLFMTTGMRKTALANIIVDDVNLEECSLTIVDKGNKRHRYVLNDSMCSALGEWLSVRDEYNKRNDDHLFLSDRGNGMSGTAIEDVVGKYTQCALGRRISPHKLRSGYCSILYKATGDIEFVRRAVGHASSRTTQRYIVTGGNEKRRAADIMSNVFE